MCNNVLLTGEILPMWSETYIIFFAKLGKDPCRVESYCPILLLNNDVKIFFTIMIKQLNKIITSYVNHDQPSFIPTRQLVDVQMHRNH